MKPRSTLLILSILSLLVGGGGGVSLYFQWKGQILIEAHRQTGLIATRLSKLISAYLEQHSKSSAALARASQFVDALDKGDAGSLAETNDLLDYYCATLTASVCYLMDKEGTVVASSNRNTPVSFVGKNYSFRPYFKNAIAGEHAVYIALGVTSKKRGVYFGSPVHLPGGGIAGVAVTKYPLEDLESEFSDLPGVVALVDSSGVILATSRSEWLFHKLGGPADKPASDNRQVERTMRLSMPGSDNATYLVSERQVDGLPGWRLVYLLPSAAADAAAYMPKEDRRIAFAFSVLFLFTMITVFSLYMISMRDIANRKKAEERIITSLREKEVLLQEIHHRVKNNLQVVSSMLSLQANTENDSKVTDALLEGERRVRVMARVHENLYRSADLASVNTSKYIEGIVNDLRHNYQDRMKDISIRIDTDDITLNIDMAIPLGQIGSELVSNALKHAFPDGRSGIVEVSFKRNNDRLVFSVADDGVGMPEETELDARKSLGLQLVNALAQKLGGEVTVSREKGTRVAIAFDGDAS